jgi:hypothetical protein
MEGSHAHDRRRSPSERRRGRRVRFVASVLKRVGDETALALSQDLGESGMQLRRVAGVTYLPRTPMMLTFELPGERELIRVRGEVVFERSAGSSWQITGVRFEDLSDADRARINRFLDEQL